jgi:hypothetical protein
MQNTPSVQNTPGKMRKKHAGAKHPARAEHTCWCKTRPEECVKQTVDAEYLDNIDPSRKWGVMETLLL